MVCVTTKISQKNRYSRLLFSLVTWAILPVWIIVFDRRSLQSKDGGKKWRLFSPSLSLWSANWYSAHDLMLLLAWPQDMIARIPVRQGVVDRVNKTQGDEHFISPPFYCLNGHCQAVESPIIGGFTTPGEEANLVIPNFPCWPGKIGEKLPKLFCAQMQMDVSGFYSNEKMRSCGHVYKVFFYWTFKKLQSRGISMAGLESFFSLKWRSLFVKHVFLSLSLKGGVIHVNAF